MDGRKTPWKPREGLLRGDLGNYIDQTMSSISLDICMKVKEGIRLDNFGGYLG